MPTPSVGKRNHSALEQEANAAIFRAAAPHIPLCSKTCDDSDISAGSTKQWHARQSRDMYVKQRAQDGYRSRAAYKLEEVQKRFGLIRKGMVVLDLGGCPGGWAQVAVKYAIRKDTGGTRLSSTDRDQTVSIRPKSQGKVISIDLLPIDPIPNVQILTGDMCDPMILDKVCTLVHGSQDAPNRTDQDAVDVVLSDMAHPFTGSRTADVARVFELCQVALRVAETPGILKRGGGFVCKFFQGEGEQELRTELKAKFDRVVYEKPNASRKASAEGYLICLGYKGRTT
ncbi:uncharacterized protein SPPG_00273 [Spizellomyces punctatus DAOM BR117]|uniref:rRNA methyltransferase 2, mitochondrial n=1 Tax=Spizellomyces punctatus (strain DAOM BR117) TaxID=645134 RepID=A0A0L0HTW6_SPIPD|nr:uncharacterized protein SPPG_00273 [Spizellomyces punctatus DAOM BR117]KND04548.1 hypothetical protein SPPG_00273 [Spizellomyces punctatus DAOM BR117]|eukprot:XP_016612587.1 hypothetical protein SPPG_00273 [Spizellomyces punctatus DAOM BR117]